MSTHGVIDLTEATRDLGQKILETALSLQRAEQGRSRILFGVPWSTGHHERPYLVAQRYEADRQCNEFIRETEQRVQAGRENLEIMFRFFGVEGHPWIAIYPWMRCAGLLDEPAPLLMAKYWHATTEGRQLCRRSGTPLWLPTQPLAGEHYDHVLAREA